MTNERKIFMAPINVPEIKDRLKALKSNCLPGIDQILAKVI